MFIQLKVPIGNITARERSEASRLLACGNDRTEKIFLSERRLGLRGGNVIRPIPIELYRVSV